MLCVLLCHHFKYLFPIYLDKVYTSTREVGELYFRAIAEVFSCDTHGRLTTIKKYPTIADVINPERLALVKKQALQIIGKAQLGKLIHLALLQMIRLVHFSPLHFILLFLWFWSTDVLHVLLPGLPLLLFCLK